LEAVIRVIQQLNIDPAVHGILVLRPLPGEVSEAKVFRGLEPGKDIESVHPENAVPAVSIGYARNAVVVSRDEWTSRTDRLASSRGKLTC
jgi:hypothetical protein